MSNWQTDEPFPPDETDIEALLALAEEEFPVVRSGLKAETVTKVLRNQWELRWEHTLWGGVATLLLLFGVVVFWPESPTDALAAADRLEDTKPAKLAEGMASDAVDWQLVEEKKALKQRNLAILRNAF